MPIYEYQCKSCGHVVELMRSVADRENPVTLRELVDNDAVKPDCSNVAPAIKGLPCEFGFVVSATPTTFRFNDFTGYRGLDETRGMNGSKRRKVDKVLKQW